MLKDPREKDEDKKELLPPHREELEVVPKPWKKSYLQALDLAMGQLHVTNPCMTQVLNMWHASFSKLRLVDIEEFHNRVDSMELQLFQNLCMRHLEAAKEKLLKKSVFLFGTGRFWYSRTQAAFCQYFILCLSWQQVVSRSAEHILPRQQEEASA